MDSIDIEVHTKETERGLETHWYLQDDEHHIYFATTGELQPGHHDIAVDTLIKGWTERKSG